MTNKRLEGRIKDVKEVDISKIEHYSREALELYNVSALDRKGEFVIPPHYRDIFGRLKQDERLLVYNDLKNRGIEFRKKGDVAEGNSYYDAAKYFRSNFIIIAGGKNL